MHGHAHSDAAAVLLLGICLILGAAWISAAAPAAWGLPLWVCPVAAAIVYLAVALGAERLCLRALALWAIMAACHVLYAALMAVAVQALRPGPAELPALLDFALRNPPAGLLQAAFVIPCALSLLWPAIAGRPTALYACRDALRDVDSPHQFLTAVLVLDSSRATDPRLALRCLASRARELLAQPPESAPETDPSEPRESVPDPTPGDDHGRESE